jgi:hypothetical protein
MATLSTHSRSQRAWELAATQHGVVALFQLLALGYTVAAIRWRVAKGRLHPVYRGVFAVGRLTSLETASGWPRSWPARPMPLSVMRVLPVYGGFEMNGGATFTSRCLPERITATRESSTIVEQGWRRRM